MGATTEMCRVVVEARAAAEVTRLSVVGSAEELGAWELSNSVPLRYGEVKGPDNGEETTTWRSAPIELPAHRFPLKLRLVANSHRTSPNTRPLVWDLAARCFPTPAADGVLRCEFEPTADDSDSGWVHRAGVGAFQLRVGQPPGSLEPLVELAEELQQPHRVELYEAKAHDPAVPQGKVFAQLSYTDMGVLQIEGAPREDNGTFLLNAQSLNALSFRVDVVSTDGSLIARAVVPHETLASLEGSFSVALLTPALQHAGTFHATFLVVTALDHPANNLGDLQRSRWAPDGPTLDIGHRGSGASRVKGHSVRENTLLSIQKAALNHTDFVEFDVHVTADGQVVVHHDFDIKLALGKEQLRLPVASLCFAQLQSPDFTRFMLNPSEGAHQPAIHDERDRRHFTLKRTMSSAEDMLRSIFKPRLSMSPDSLEPIPVRTFLSDRLASLADVFRRTPTWLGFNIELKYPTPEEVTAMGARFYSRNHFVDAVLKVVLEEAGGRRVIFSTFDPDCAALLSLKQPRYPVLFLTCGGTKQFVDPRMNSLEAALQFALASHLQGVVAEATAVLDRLEDAVGEFHRHRLFLFTWGDINNDMDSYMAQKRAGIDGVIMDDVARIAKATNKQHPALFAKPIRVPSSLEELTADPATSGLRLDELKRLTSSISMLALSPVVAPLDRLGMRGEDTAVYSI